MTTFYCAAPPQESLPVVPKPVLARVWILRDAVAGTGIQPVGATARAKSAAACKGWGRRTAP